MRIAALLLALSGLAQAGSPYVATDYDEPLRGQFHFSSQSGWMNDVNGPVYYRGTYHLFYQHNPHGRDWNTMHWGHATSPDLLHWTQQPVALEPGVHSDVATQPNALFSGSAWVDSGNVTKLKVGTHDPILLFHNTEGVSVSYSVDGGRTFKPYRNGAKLIRTAEESRDPKVQWDPEHKRWVMVMWRKGHGANFWRSRNLLDWTEVGSTAPWVFECPDLFSLLLDGDAKQRRWVLQDASGRYVVGRLDVRGMFVSDWPEPLRMDKAEHTRPEGNWYAAQTFNQLPGGRIVQMAWQGRHRGETWTGNASFPLALSLKTLPGVGVRLLRQPIAELEKLAAPGLRERDQVVEDILAVPTADTYELTADVDLARTTAPTLTLSLFSLEGGAPQRIVISPRERRVDGHVVEGAGSRLKLQVLVDRGQLEIFANDGVLAISRNVDFAPGPRRIEWTVSEGRAVLTSMTVKPIAGTWKPAPGGNRIRPASGPLCLGSSGLSTCTPDPRFDWTWADDLSLRQNGRCLDDAARSTACNGKHGQQWRQTTNGELINLGTGRCLTLDADGVALANCAGTANQRWHALPFIPAMRTLRAGDRCLTFDDARLAFKPCGAGWARSWRPTPNAELSHAWTHDRQCLDAGEGGIRIAACNGSASQRWREAPDGRVSPVGSAQCLRATDAGPALGDCDASALRWD